MNAQTKIEPGTDLAVIIANDPGIVLLDTEKFDAWYERLKAEAPIDVDVSTNKGRDTLRSFAAKVRSEKAAIDKARLRLTKGWRDMVDQANTAGKVIAERLESLAIETRQPLTDWEEAEKSRIAECESLIREIKAAATITIEDTSETVRARGMEAYASKDRITETRFQDLYEQAMQVRSDTIGALKTALDRLIKEEADRAELEQLRAEATERDAREAAEREARERAEQEAEQARITEARRILTEQAERAREERIAREAAERAQREAEKAAEAERQRLQREHDEALAAERRRAEEAEAAKAAVEREREEEAERQRAEAQRLADQKATDEENKALQRRLKTEAKEALMSCGASEEVAQKIVLAIRAKEIPHVKWSV